MKSEWSTRPRHIALVGPFASDDMAFELGLTGAELNNTGPSSASPNLTSLPRGYPGAPVLCVLAGELLRRGHRVSIITLSSDLPLHADEFVQVQSAAYAGRLSVTYCPMRPRAWPLNGWRLGRIVDLYAFERQALRAALLRARPEVVHAHWAGEFAWAALRSSLPTLVTCHDSPWQVARWQRRWRHKGYRWLRAAMAAHVLRQARVLSAVSPFLAQALARNTRAKIHVVPNPVPSPTFDIRQSEEQEHDPMPCRVLLVTNGFGALKNVAAAMLAFQIFARTEPQAQLLLVGHDMGPGEAAQQWWGVRGGALRFLGTLPHAQVLALMAQCSVLLHPAHEEAFGMVPAEALAAGLPVVAGERSGAVPWVVGAHATLVDVRQPALMAQALSTVIALSRQHPDDARECRLAGALAMRQRFALEGVVMAYEALYEQAMSCDPSTSLTVR